MGRGVRFGRRARALAALVAVGGLLLVGLTLGERGSGETGMPRGERDNRDRSELKTTTTTRRTTTTTTIPVGPVFGAPVGASLLVGMSGSARWTLLDLDTGARSDVRLRTEDPWAAVPVRRGIVVVRAGTAHLVVLDPGDPAASDGLLGSQSTPLGDADLVVATDSPDRVWLVRFTSDFTQRTMAQLVDLVGRPLSDVVEVPAQFVIGAIDEGPVFAAGGRAFIAEERGARPLAVGDVLDMAGGRIALRTCDDRASCSVVIRDLVSGRTTRIAATVEQSDVRSTVVLAPDGQVALFGYEQAPRLAIFDADGDVLGSGPVGLVQGDPAWLPGTHGLLVPSGDGLRRIVPADGGLSDGPMPALDGVRADLVYVIPR